MEVFGTFWYSMLTMYRQKCRFPRKVRGQNTAALQKCGVQLGSHRGFVREKSLHLSLTRADTLRCDVLCTSLYWINLYSQCSCHLCGAHGPLGNWLADSRRISADARMARSAVPSASWTPLELNMAKHSAIASKEGTTWPKAITFVDWFDFSKLVPTCFSLGVHWISISWTWRWPYRMDHAVWTTRQAL